MSRNDEHQPCCPETNASAVWLVCLQKRLRDTESGTSNICVQFVSRHPLLGHAARAPAHMSASRRSGVRQASTLGVKKGREENEDASLRCDGAAKIGHPLNLWSPLPIFDIISWCVLAGTYNSWHVLRLICTWLKWLLIEVSHSKVIKKMGINKLRQCNITTFGTPPPPRSECGRHKRKSQTVDARCSKYVRRPASSPSKTLGIKAPGADHFGESSRKIRSAILYGRHRCWPSNCVDHGG